MIGMGWLRRIIRGRRLGRGDSGDFGELGGLYYHFSILMVGVNWRFWIHSINIPFPDVFKILALSNSLSELSALEI
jgi:hypothetical protein